MNYPLRLAPGKTEGIPVEGDFLCVTFSPCDIEISVDGRGKATYNQGDSRTLTGGRMFRRLEVRNPTAGTIDVIIFAGTDRYSQARQAILEPKTRVVGDSGTLAGNTPLDLDPALVLVGGDIRRKAVTISNPDTTLKLELRDEANVAFDIIEPKDTKIFPISERFFLYNPNGSALQYSLGHIIWRA
jgi:hypothetical protein